MSATLDESKPRLNLDALVADMPPRIARIETHIEHMRETIGKLEVGQEKLRETMTGEFKVVRTEMTAGFTAVRAEMRAESKWLLRLVFGLGGLTLTGFVSLWGAIIAHHFGWLK